MSIAPQDARFVRAELEHIRLDRAGRRVLADVSWRIAPGERWLLIGPNGAGKSQLLKLLAGIVWPTPGPPGRIGWWWRGELWRSAEGVRDAIAYVGPERQDRYERLGPEYTALEIAGTGLKHTDIPLERLDPPERAALARLLARVGIGELARRHYASLSSGERRLVLLARALAGKPGLLLLDELLTGLDARHRARTLRFLDDSKSRLPWVLSSHRAEELPRSLTHALVLEAGWVRYCGPLRGAPLQQRLAPAAALRRVRRARRPPRPTKLIELVRASVWIEGRRILSGLDWSLKAGESWFLHGHNGAGKSTLLRALYGDLGVAAGGSIHRHGIVPGVPLERFRRRVGYVAPHLHALQPREASVLEVVRSGLEACIAPAPGRAGRARALAVVRRFGLGGLESVPCGALSYGQMRRALFARAFVGRPRVLLLDEPGTGLDAQARAELLGHVRSFIVQGGAVVLASHLAGERALCDREVELAGGRIRYAGPLRTTAGAAA